MKYLLLFLLIIILVPTIIVLLIVKISKTSSSRSAQMRDYMSANPQIQDGNYISENPQTQNGNPVIIVRENSSNGVGIAGFILALIGLIFCWVPVIDWILWILGAILSIVGCFREPRGLAIAGVVISFIGIILIIAVIGALASIII
ncbi:MAG: hypothetical protein LBK58_08415 [Prevotellaceae bacterium]|jgi:hypothetical protein|nr:hypothetical protein [Prevotellaceae bacterium]